MNRFFRTPDQGGNEIPPVAQRNYEKPVAWLLGYQVINSFRGALLYAALGSKLDARDWMDAEIFELEESGKNEFWFDYLSDTGDGVTATYSLAYLSMSDLWVKENGARGKDDAVKLAKQEGSDFQLPRGQFLFVGGDTAYHTSNYTTLANRFQLPFRWAYADLMATGCSEEFCRPLFGVPGNHDYYDQLDGFRRQFRAPVRKEDCGRLYPETKDPLLMIPGHRRLQTASYIGLKLPFGWWMWGLDTEVGEVDERQLKFFREIKTKDDGSLDEGVIPDKLIVTTCAPTTVFGNYADGEKDTKSARSFRQLGLPRPFLPEEELETEEPRLEGHQIRLDLSGDIHLYARYWGPPSGENPRENATAPQPSSANYASVVSGIGGAFHHPSQTYVDEVREQTLYPPVDVSRAAVAREVFKPWKLWSGGGVWLVGLLAGFIIYFAATIVPSSRDAISNLYLNNFLVRDFSVWSTLGFAHDRKICPTIPSEDLPRETKPFRLWSALLPSVPESRPPLHESQNLHCSRLPLCPTPTGAQPAYFSGPCAVENTPDDYSLGVILALLTLMPIIAGTLKRKWYFRDPDLERTTTTWMVKAGARPRPWFKERPFLTNVFLAALPMMALAALAVLSIRPYRAHITPFGNSLLVLLSLAWAISAFVLDLRYTDWLFHKTMVRRLNRWDWLVPWALRVYAVLAVGFGVWFFGRNNQMAYLVHDILFVIVVLSVFLGLIMLGYVKAGELREGFVARLPFLLLGALHGFTQIAVPFVLVRKGSWLTLLLALVLVAAFGFAGWQLMRRNLKWILAATGLVYSALMISLPYLTARLLESSTYSESSGLFSRGFYDGWLGLAPAIASGIIAAIMACVWLGWYLAIALEFNGHNNEAGGAAQIERFKEFIRIRLARDPSTGEDTLTAFVIAVDEPQKSGANLKPRLVDVFTLRRAGATTPATEKEALP
jgi:hypothetical protein